MYWEIYLIISWRNTAFDFCKTVRDTFLSFCFVSSHHKPSFTFKFGVKSNFTDKSFKSFRYRSVLFSFFFFFPLSWRLNSFQSLCLFKLAWKMFLAVVIADYHCAVVVVSVHSSPCWLSLFDAFIKWNLKIIYNMNKINQDGSFLGGPRSQTELNQKDLCGLRTINCKKSRKSSKSRLTFELTSLSMVSIHVFLDVISCNRYLTFFICL